MSRASWQSLSHFVFDRRRLPTGSAPRPHVCPTKIGIEMAKFGIENIETYWDMWTKDFMKWPNEQMNPTSIWHWVNIKSLNYIKLIEFIELRNENILVLWIPGVAGGNNSEGFELGNFWWSPRTGTTWYFTCASGRVQREQSRIQQLIGFRNKCLRIQKLVLSDSEANENGFRN